jgi:hypothetical protein
VRSHGVAKTVWAMAERVILERAEDLKAFLRNSQ